MLRAGGVLCDLYKTAAPYHHGVACRPSAEVCGRISNNLSLHQLLCSAVSLFVSTPIFALLFSCLSPFAPLLFCCCLFFFHSNVCSSAVSLFLSIRTFALPFPCLLPFHSGLRLAGFLFFPIQTSLWCFLVYFHLSLSLLFSCLFQFQPLHCCFLVCFHSHFSCLFPFQSCCYFHFSFGSLCGFVC